MSSGNRQTSNYVSFSPWLQLTSGSTWEPARLCSPPWGRRQQPRPRRLRPSGRGPARVSPPRPACSCRAGRKGWRESAATPAPTTSRQTAGHTMLEDCHTGALSYPGDVGRQNISKHGEKVKCQKTCQWYEVFLRNEEVWVDSVHVWSIKKVLHCSVQILSTDLTELLGTETASQRRPRKYWQVEGSIFWRYSSRIERISQISYFH